MTTKTVTYSAGQVVCFWLFWLLLLIPLYYAAAGAWFIGALLSNFNDLMDIGLALTFGLTALVILALALSSVVHFFRKQRRFTGLMGRVFLGLFVVPMVASFMAAGIFVGLNDQPLSYYKANYEAFVTEHAPKS